MSQKLITIRTNKEVQDLISYLEDKEYCSFDTETTGITEDSEVIGYSICAESGVGYYVITAYWGTESKSLKYLETKDSAQSVMECLKKKKLIMHNAVFDCAMVTRNYKVDLIQSVFCDTMIMAHLIDENRAAGLKELGYFFYGSSAKKEQEEMKESVAKNGGVLTKKEYELYKADADLIAKYGAKDAILTYNLFYELLPELYEEGMDKFYFEDESIPLLKGPTYQLNTVGLKVDQDKLAALKKSLELEILELKGFIYKEIQPYIEEDYPGTNKKNTFNIGSGQQLAWLLFEKLNNTFHKVSNAGQELAKALGMRTPYKKADKDEFIAVVKQSFGQEWRESGAVWDKKTKKYKGSADVGHYWKYLSTDKVVLGKFAKKYKWVESLLQHKKLTKLLNTYVEGISEQMRYGIIHPSFLQHGTTSGRYSSKKPNFQNLPRDDKRVKQCIISRPGKVFVGADYSQLEPRVFASYSKDVRLLKCFEEGMDFYSVIGIELFNKKDCSPFKKDENFFGKKYEDLRNKVKVVALSATYGTTANKMAPGLGVERDEAQVVIDNYFKKFPQVELMMLEAHKLVKKNGYVENLFGRKRRIPEAQKIEEMFGDSNHAELPYATRNLLNLAVNHRIQSTSASIMNRAAIKFLQFCAKAGIDAKIVMQVHDELIVECDEKDAEEVSVLLKYSMEQTVQIPGVALVAEPKIGRNLAELK